MHEHFALLISDTARLWPLINDNLANMRLVNYRASKIPLADQPMKDNRGFNIWPSRLVPKILVISKGGRGSTHDVHPFDKLYDALERKAHVVYASDAAGISSAFAGVKEIDVVLVMDMIVISRAHHAIGKRLAAFAREGGKLIFGFGVSSLSLPCRPRTTIFLPPLELSNTQTQIAQVMDKPAQKDIFLTYLATYLNLGWKLAPAESKQLLTLNTPDCTAHFIQTARHPLSPYTIQRSVPLLGPLSQLSSRESVLTSAPFMVHVAWEHYGEGRVAWVGDMGLEEGSVQVVEAMCGFAALKDRRVLAPASPLEPWFTDP